MTRHRRILTGLFSSLLVVSALAGCGGSSDAAAKVNGEAISEDELIEELELLTEHPSFAQALLGWTASPMEGTRVDTELAAQLLSVRILLTLVDQEFNRRGLVVDDEARAGAETTFEGGFDALLAELPADYQESFITWNAQLWALRTALAAEATDDDAEVTDDEVRAYFDENGALFGEQVCLSHILVDTQGEAETILTELEGGADFAATAAARSTDPSAASNRGDLGCNPENTFVPEFEEVAWSAPIGEVAGPVETQFGFHLILVASRGPVEFTDVEADIRSFLEAEAANAPQQLLSELIVSLGDEAEIWVNPKYGTWDAEAGTVVPPEGPATPGTTPATTAATAPATTSEP